MGSKTVRTLRLENLGDCLWCKMRTSQYVIVHNVAPDEMDTFCVYRVAGL